jgi:hypothetical protein
LVEVLKELLEQIFWHKKRGSEDPQFGVGSSTFEFCNTAKNIILATLAPIIKDGIKMRVTKNGFTCLS